MIFSGWDHCVGIWSSIAAAVCHAHLASAPATGREKATRMSQPLASPQTPGAWTGNSIKNKQTEITTKLQLNKQPRRAEEYPYLA